MNCSLTMVSRLFGSLLQSSCPKFANTVRLLCTRALANPALSGPGLTTSWLMDKLAIIYYLRGVAALSLAALQISPGSCKYTTRPTL